jgi:tetratricopeptide (TPR) repeat protein
VTQTLWPVYFSAKSNLSLEASIDKLTSAIAQWPLSDFYQRRALNHVSLADSDSYPADAVEAKENAIGDYKEASRLHPFDPSFVINRANILSGLERDSEAEQDYANAILLQGGMEPAFRGHLFSAVHYLRKGIRLFDNSEIPQSLASLEMAAAQIETACEMMHWIAQDMVDVRISIHESLGKAKEASDDLQGALESYDFASTFDYGNRAHYRAGTLLGKMADIAWKARRPEEAMALFIKARHRVSITHVFPAGVTQIQRVEYLAYLDQTIAFFKAAKVTPLPDGGEN